MNEILSDIQTAEELFQFLNTIPTALRSKLFISVQERDIEDEPYEGIDIHAYSEHETKGELEQGLIIYYTK